MAKLRKGIPKTIKKALIEEVGGKCANPGCSNYRVHIHHIRQWAVYQTHDEKYMIAVCPSCHDAIHNGSLRIDDETLLRWKQIKRINTEQDHLYIEPGLPPKLILGTIAVTGEDGLTVFELSPNNRLSFRIIDGDIFLVNLSISTVTGQEVLQVIENHVKYQARKPLQYHRRPGKIRITAPAKPEFLPTWSLKLLQIQEPTYAANSLLVLLDIEVLEPGLVQLQGIWAEQSRIIVITKERFSFITPNLQQPLSLCGTGKNSVLRFKGPITSRLFGF